MNVPSAPRETSTCASSVATASIHPYSPADGFWIQAQRFFSARDDLAAKSAENQLVDLRLREPPREGTGVDRRLDAVFVAVQHGIEDLQRTPLRPVLDRSAAMEPARVFNERRPRLSGDLDHLVAEL